MHGLVSSFTQENLASSPRSGTLRGLHFQRSPHAEAKLVRCTRGRVWDVAVDLRPSSPAYRRSIGIELGADDARMLYVPEGCAHGYVTLDDDTEVCYLTSHRYAPHAAAGVRYDDPLLAIEWPCEIVLASPADRGWPLVEEQIAGGAG